jgi:surfeit locus 1 family protein
MRKVSLFIVYIAALITLITLGFWQLQRLAWKENLITQVQLRKNQAPVTLPLSLEQGVHEFMKVRLTGLYLSDLESRYYTVMPSFVNNIGGQGYYSIVPFKLEDGRVLLVNRGFVPLDKWGNIKIPLDKITLEGVVRFSEKRSTFSAVDDGIKRIFYTRDSAAIYKALNITGLHVFVDRTDKGELALPQVREASYSLPNNHLDYALTWFGLALTMLVISGIYWFKRRHHAK